MQSQPREQKRFNNKKRFDLPTIFESKQIMTLREEKARDFVFKVCGETAVKYACERTPEYYLGTNMDGVSGSEDTSIVKITMYFDEFKDFCGNEKSDDVYKILQKIQDTHHAIKLNKFALENGKLNYDRKVVSESNNGLIMGLEKEKEGRRVKFTFYISREIEYILTTGYDFTVLLASLNKQISSKYSYKFLKKIMRFVSNGKKHWTMEEFREDLGIPSNKLTHKIKSEIIDKIMEDLKDSDIILQEPIYTYSKKGDGKKTITDVEFRYKLKNQYSLETQIHYFKLFLFNEIEDLPEVYHYEDCPYKLVKQGQQIFVSNRDSGVYFTKPKALKALMQIWARRQELHYEEIDGETDKYFDFYRKTDGILEAVDFYQTNFDLFFTNYIKNKKIIEDKQKKEAQVINKLFKEDIVLVAE